MTPDTVVRPATAKFFGPSGTGATKTGLALDAWTDLSFQESALHDLGTN